MSYRTAQNVTPINMLPELEDLEAGNLNQPSSQGGEYATTATYTGATMLPPKESEKFGRFIRGSHQAPNASGMAPYNQAPQPMGPPGPQVPAEHYGTPIGQEGPAGQEGLKTFSMPKNSPSCLDVAEHIANCPICSKFYNNDKTIYIIAIVVLAVVCILLLKRVLDV